MQGTDRQIIHAGVERMAADAKVNPAALHSIVDLAKQRGHFFAQPQAPWRKPQLGDSEKTCPILNLQIALHGQKGLIVFIPIQEEPPK